MYMEISADVAHPRRFSMTPPSVYMNEDYPAAQRRHTSIAHRSLILCVAYESIQLADLL